MNDYNFETPSTNLEVTSASAVEVGGNRRYELYEHPGDYRRKGARRVTGPNPYPRNRVDLPGGEWNKRVSGDGDRLSFHSRSGHDRQELNQTYVITNVHHEAGLTGQARRMGIYTNEFVAIPYSVPFRPLRLTARPVVRGPETGVVVGPKGEEIFVDQYGRVKVQFHWDRQGKKDENSSGWIRVAQPWAGKQWGTLFIPRVGDEVLVEFLHGDLHRPVVIGSLYNGEDRPPNPLPAGPNHDDD